MCFLLNLSHCDKSYGHFCQILALFLTPAHQIWSCHVTRDASFEKFLFCPNSTSNIKRSHKSSSGKAFYFRSYQKNLKGGGGPKPSPSPVPAGVKQTFDHHRLFIFCFYGLLFTKFLKFLKFIINFKFSSGVIEIFMLVFGNFLKTNS